METTSPLQWMLSNQRTRLANMGIEVPTNKRKKLNEEEGDAISQVEAIPKEKWDLLPYHDYKRYASEVIKQLNKDKETWGKIGEYRRDGLIHRLKNEERGKLPAYAFPDKVEHDFIVKGGQFDHLIHLLFRALKKELYLKRFSDKHGCVQYTSRLFSVFDVISRNLEMFKKIWNDYEEGELYRYLLLESRYKVDAGKLQELLKQPVGKTQEEESEEE